MPKVFITDNPYDADEKVYIVDEVFEADEKVFVVDKWNADKKVFVVDNKWDADRKVFVVANEWDADTPVSFLGSEEGRRPTPPRNDPDTIDSNSAAYDYDYGGSSFGAESSTSSSSCHNPYCEHEDDGVLRRAGCATLRIAVGLIAAAITWGVAFFALLIVLSVHARVTGVTGTYRLGCPGSLLFFFFWWTPPLIVFICVSGVAELLWNAWRQRLGR
jgi:hypothetical protein